MLTYIEITSRAVPSRTIIADNTAYTTTSGDARDG